MSDAVNLSKSEENDLSFLDNNIKVLYETFLKVFAERIIEVNGSGDFDIKELLVLKKNWINDIVSNFGKLQG